MKVKDHLVSQETYEVIPWGSGSIRQTLPVPDNLTKYYASSDYVSHSDRKKGLMEWVYAQAKRFHLKWKLGIIGKHSKPGVRLLDFGAGTGDFVGAAQVKGYNAVGVEPGKKARDIAATKGVELQANTEALSDQRFDVITLWHVLEHIPNWEKALQEFHAMLSDAGILVLALPNFESCDAHYYKEFWAAYDVPRHLWHFSPAAIDEHIVPIGFQKAGMKRMWLDAFYVSWLSERHKGKSFAGLRGICVGLWSNFKSVFSGQASSMIYILQKQPLN
ncbi:Methyltransferase domain-containing protein [Robiginitalea myxolifaciens]|uniref:Methyltransferase domain-containing protein n=1 Tax=Robiginitalea myxolifaciens TaxID=400055 RepID=A0A1I6G308_9FLAO|nr:class I SAM-dependent methyltransferase [Robiginitalea myxolifaciens]SFR36569.1 Methyltransferase domain-containing protein [Robiginitalea myxolifaciens]